jgi:hypothetical protein
MNMELIKKYKVIFIIAMALVVLVGIFSFFYRMYNNDMIALEVFVVSYEKFDKAISEFSVNKTDDLENKANDALFELNANANFRVSSLIRNDSLIPAAARKVVDLAGKEIESLRAYKIAIQSNSANVERLAKDYNNLTSERKTAYASFQELGQK